MNDYNFKPFDKVLVRDSEDSKWQCSFFSHKESENVRFKFVTTNGFHLYCVPYEGNEYLLGTKNKPNMPSKTEKGKTITINVPEYHIPYFNMTTDTIGFIEMTPKRWRAEGNDFYYFAGSDGNVYSSVDRGSSDSNTLYEIGNYFRTEEEAQAMAEKFKQLLKEG